MLIVISDGAPVDDSTLQANSVDYPADHLRTVIATIDAQGDIVLGALGLEHHASAFYSRYRETHLLDELSAALFALLEEAIAAGRPED